MRYQRVADQLRDAAEALEDMQRAQNHLQALLATWSELTDAERFVDVSEALKRLDGTWSGRVEAAA